MGSLNNRPMDGVTGAIGPAVVVRTAFDILNGQTEPTQLWLSPRLRSYSICIDTGYLALPEDRCRTRTEFFIEGTEPKLHQSSLASSNDLRVRIANPTENLEIAIDPRVPTELQAMEFVLDGVTSADSVVWNINGNSFPSKGGSFLWHLETGKHVLKARVMRDGLGPESTQSVTFSIH